MLRKSIQCLSFVVLATNFSCKSTSNAALTGLSKNHSAKNVALLMTAYNQGESVPFTEDAINMETVLRDNQSNLDFTVLPLLNNGTESQMLDAIRQASTLVNTDGTFALFIAAHGSPSGEIKPSDQVYASLGFQDVINAIKAGRKGLGPMQRFVFYVSACYSGSWLQKLPKTKEIAKEIIVITSTVAYNLSYMPISTKGMLEALDSLAKKPDATIGQFLTLASKLSVKTITVNGGYITTSPIQFYASPKSVLAERLRNRRFDVMNAQAWREDFKILTRSNIIKSESQSAKEVGQPARKLWVFANQRDAVIGIRSKSGRISTCGSPGRLTERTRSAGWRKICGLQIPQSVSEKDSFEVFMELNGVTYKTTSPHYRAEVVGDIIEEPQEEEPILPAIVGPEELNNDVNETDDSGVVVGLKIKHPVEGDQLLKL